MDDFGDLSAEEAPAPPPPPKIKKSLFSKKITTKIPDSEEPVDFYSRAKDVYHIQQAEEERRRQKKLVKLERKRSSTSAEVKEKSPSGDKRRRVSEQRDAYSPEVDPVNDVVETNESRKNSAHSAQNSQGKERYRVRGSPTTLSARYTKELSARKSDSPQPQRDIAKGYISLSESDEAGASDGGSGSVNGASTLAARKPNQAISLDDDDDDFAIAPRVIRPPPPPVEDDANMSEEEFPELVAAAKERQRQQAALKAKAEAAAAGKPQGDLDGDDIFDTDTNSTNMEPIIEILVTSKIQGTKPVGVKRKLYGKLREVRWAWCDKQVIDGQKMSEEVKESIFLTWKGNKLYDFSNCSGCVEGEKLAMGSVGDGKVHLEAWTEETFEAWKKGHEAKQRGEREHSEDEPVPEPDPVQRTRLIMKSRDFSDYKLMVKPHTTIQKIMDAFRREKNVPDEKDVTLHFDGDKLEPDDKVKDTELGDMDSVEVHIQ